MNVVNSKFVCWRKVDHSVLIVLAIASPRQKKLIQLVRLWNIILSFKYILYYLIFDKIGRFYWMKEHCIVDWKKRNYISWRYVQVRASLTVNHTRVVRVPQLFQSHLFALLFISCAAFFLSLHYIDITASYFLNKELIIIIESWVDSYLKLTS